MDRNSLFSNDFKSVELCKQMQKKCSIESTSFRPTDCQIDYYDDDSIDENEICSVDGYDEPRQDNNSNASLSLSGFKLPTESNLFLAKNKQHANGLASDGGPFTPAGEAYVWKILLKFCHTMCSRFRALGARPFNSLNSFNKKVGKVRREVQFY